MSSAILKDAPFTNTLAARGAGWIFNSPVGPKVLLAPETEAGQDLIGDDAADAFLGLWKKGAPEELPGNEDEEDEVETSEEETEETEETGDDQETEETEEETEEEEADEDEESEEDEGEEKPKKVLKDDAVTKFKVDGKEVEVPVSKLQRLYGQEAALTRKSQEVAETRKKLEDQGATYVAASETMLTRARERFEQYDKIDWVLAAKELDGEEYKALRAEGQKAYADVQFYEKELGTFMQGVHEARHTALVAEAKATLSALQDPKTGIKGFNQAVYGEMQGFAINHGVPKEVMDNLVSEPIMRILHKAMLYEKGQKAVTKTKDLKPKKIIKSKTTGEAARNGFTPKTTTKALANLKKTGSQDAATDAFLASFMAE